jgi:hypothetical protein
MYWCQIIYCMCLLRIVDIFNLCKETHHSLLIILFKNVKYYFILHAFYSTFLFYFLFFVLSISFNEYEEYNFARTRSTAVEKVVEMFHYYVNCSSFDIDNLVYCINYVIFEQSNFKRE